MKPVNSSSAPRVIGPYSQAMSFGDLLFLSGQIPLDPQSMEIKAKDIESQTHQVFDNIKAILNESGLSLFHIIKTTVYLKNMDDFAKMNEVYAMRMGVHKPARSTIEVSRLPKDALVEIECLASTFK